MYPRIIHLIWLGENNELAVSAQKFWQSMGSGCDVVLHRDESALLPQWKELWDSLTSPVVKSDLLRWSLLLSQGGWYFDCDVRSHMTIGEIERDCQLDGSALFVTHFGSSRSEIVSDILACSVGWLGRDAVVDYISRQEDINKLPVVFAYEMLTAIYRQHQNWFASAPSDRYSMLNVPRIQQVFSRSGQPLGYIRDETEKQECVAVCQNCLHYLATNSCAALGGEQAIAKYSKRLTSGNCPYYKWPTLSRDELLTKTPVVCGSPVYQQAPDGVTQTEVNRRVGLCLACKNWQTVGAHGCILMKECDRELQWPMEHRFKSPTGRCLQAYKGGVDKWAMNTNVGVGKIAKPRLTRQKRKELQKRRFMSPIQRQFSKIKPPTLLDEVRKWIQGGRQIRSEEEMNKLFAEFCGRCINNKEGCSLCGSPTSLKSRLRMATISGKDVFINFRI